MGIMKVRYTGKTNPLFFTHGEEYEVLAKDKHDTFRIIDDTGEDYLYGLDNFEFVSGDKNLFPKPAA